MIRIAICDGEPLTCIHLENMLDIISERYSIEIDADTFHSGEALYHRMITQNFYDVIFLNVELKRLDGIETGTLIRKKFGINSTQIVYMATEEKYAMKLFRTRPMDFLIKPIRYADVLYIIKSIDMLKQELEYPLFGYHFGTTRYKIPCQKILYFESNCRQVNIVTTTNIGCFYSTLAKIHDRLPKTDFISIHKSYLINFAHIKAIEYHQVTMSNNRVLPISQSHRKNVRAVMMQREEID